jgi:hypothetical protein
MLRTLTRFTRAAWRLYCNLIFNQGKYLCRAAFDADTAGIAQIIINFGNSVDNFYRAGRTILFALHTLDATALTVFHNNGFSWIAA